jgi:hypothetical protein
VTGDDEPLSLVLRALSGDGRSFASFTQLCGVRLVFRNLDAVEAFLTREERATAKASA